MPRVTYASVARPHPGRLADAVELARQAGKLTGRHGAEARLLNAELAGEQVGTLVFTIEFDDNAAYTRAVDEMDQDAELQQLQQSLLSSSAPIVTLSTSLTTELPLTHQRKRGHGRIVEVHLVKVVPGRFEEAVEQASRACTFAQSQGAVNAQGFQMVYAGAQAGTCGVAWEWESVRAQAASGDAWMNDPVGAALAAEQANGTGPTTIISSALYRDIPL